MGNKPSRNIAIGVAGVGSCATLYLLASYLRTPKHEDSETDTSTIIGESMTDTTSTSSLSSFETETDSENSLSDEHTPRVPTNYLNGKGNAKQRKKRQKKSTPQKRRYSTGTLDVQKGGENHLLLNEAKVTENTTSTSDQERDISHNSVQMKSPMEAFSRQKVVPDFPQHLIEKQIVMCLGVGGIGCSVASGVVRLGVPRLILLDNDVVCESNLNRYV